MEILAKKSGYAFISDLHTNEISIQLQEFIASKSYIKWNRFSRDRLKFDAIVRNCKNGIATFLDPILEIIKESCLPDKDIELRMDMHVLLEYILGIEEIAENIKEKSQFLLSVIFSFQIKNT